MNAPNVALIAGRLSELEIEFLGDVIAKTRLPLATRERDRARQSIRRMGLVRVMRNPRRWEALPLGLAVWQYLMEKNDGC